MRTDINTTVLTRTKPYEAAEPSQGCPSDFNFNDCHQCSPTYQSPASRWLPQNKCTSFLYIFATESYTSGPAASSLFSFSRCRFSARVALRTLSRHDCLLSSFFRTQSATATTADSSAILEASQTRKCHHIYIVYKWGKRLQHFESGTSYGSSTDTARNFRNDKMLTTVCVWCVLFTSTGRFF